MTKCKQCGKTHKNEKFCSWKCHNKYRKNKSYEKQYGRKKTKKIKSKIAKKIHEQLKGISYEERFGKEKELLITEKQSNSMKGKNNPMYKNGKSHMRRGYDKIFRGRMKKLIKKRDKICQVCFKEMNKRLECHHIHYNKKDSRLKTLVLVHSKCNGFIHRKSENKDYWLAYFCYLLNQEPEDILYRNVSG